MHAHLTLEVKPWHSNKGLIALLLLSAAASVWADDPCQTNSSPFGPMTCGAGVTPRIDANGPVTLNDTIVKGATNVKWCVNRR